MQGHCNPQSLYYSWNHATSGSHLENVRGANSDLQKALEIAILVMRKIDNANKPSK